MIGVAVIVGESTDVMGAEDTSRWLYPVWVAIFGRISMHDWAIVHHILRKAGHFTGYGLVCLAFYKGWGPTLAPKWLAGLWALRRRAALLALLCTLAIASGDEYHQSFLPHRTSSIYDVGIDVSGATTALLLLFAGLGVLNRRHPKLEEDRRPIPAAKAS